MGAKCRPSDVGGAFAGFDTHAGATVNSVTVYNMQMTATLPKRFEPFVVPGGLKGQISELPVPDILQHLRASASTGILTLVAGGARKALYVKDGRVVFASSNLPNDRLGEILLREGKITVEE